MEVTADRSFRRALALIAFGALAVRIGVAWYFEYHTRAGGDALWYVGIARFLPEGIGFVEPLHHNFANVRIESAAHPPLYPVFLSIIDFLGLDTNLMHRLWSCVPGTVTVVLVGLIGRDLAGRRAGVVAAVCAAASISLAVQDVLMWSEGFYGMTIAFVVLLSYRYLRDPSLRGAVLLTVGVSLCALTRAEAALLYFILVVPLVLRAVDQWRARLRGLLACALTALVLFSPWLIYNAGRFEHPVITTTTFGALLASSNCPGTYYGPRIGGWGGACAEGMPDPIPRDETVAEVLYRKAGWRYIKENADRLPVVIPIRLLRTFGFWQPAEITAEDLQLDDAGISWVAYLAVAQYWLYLGLGLVGLWIMRQRRQPIWPFLAPVITIAVMTVIGHGTMRFRVGLEVLLPILVGVAVSTVLARRNHHGVRSGSVAA